MPKYLVDAMLGNVATKLRMLGYDAAYCAGGADMQHVASSGRVLVTRSGSLLAAAARLRVATITGRTEDSIMRRILHGRRPVVSAARSRCSICNGRTALSGDRAPPGSADPRTWRCMSCGHTYWEGSHMAHVREAARRWA